MTIWGIVGTRVPTMPRPQRYARRVDTKVRLRQDHRDLLDQKVEETPGLSRNALLEQILDAHFKVKAPRLKRTPVDPELQRAAQSANARTTPRLRHPGEEMEDAQEGTDVPPVVPPKTPRPAPGSAVAPGPRVKPRQRRI